MNIEIASMFGQVKLGTATCEFLGILPKPLKTVLNDSQLSNRIFLTNVSFSIVPLLCGIVNFQVSISTFKVDEA